jgi:predicted dehydrogenase
MKIALVGCGFVADYYAATLKVHPELEVACIVDRNPERCRIFSEHYGFKACDSIDDILSDPEIEIVVNLTNPSEHHGINMASLEAGKHVYCEKPLAMRYENARDAVEYSKSLGLILSGAPCTALSDTAQSIWKSLRQNLVGQVEMVYAELDDGVIHRAGCESWKSMSGAPWPYADEFNVGCTLEHAGYYLTWLAMMFGPAREIHSFSTCIFPDKTPPSLNEELGIECAPDYSVANIRYDNNIHARLTCSIVTARDHRLRILGDKGRIEIDDCWQNTTAIRHYDYTMPRQRFPLSKPYKNLPLARKIKAKRYYHKNYITNIDYARGVNELAQAINQKRPCRLSPDFVLHITETALAIQHPPENGLPYVVVTDFEPMAPMDWAE